MPTSNKLKAERQRTTFPFTSSFRSKAHRRLINYGFSASRVCLDITQRAPFGLTTDQPSNQTLVRTNSIPGEAMVLRSIAVGAVSSELAAPSAPIKTPVRRCVEAIVAATLLHGEWWWVFVPLCCISSRNYTSSLVNLLPAYAVEMGKRFVWRMNYMQRPVGEPAYCKQYFNVHH